MRKKLGVSIIICSYNSQRTIEKALVALSEQKVSSHREWEILLIDNCSEDNTITLVKSLLRTNKVLNSKLKIIKESKLGISNARLRGLRSSKFEILSFIDDDNIVSKDWIESVAFIMENHKEVGVCGGQNKSPKIEHKPFWFEKYKECYALGKQALKSGDITLGRGFVWGAGMSIRKTAWIDINKQGFKFFLTGRIGNKRSAGEDSELGFALRLAGWRIWYQNDLTLIHEIDPNRLDWRELRKMFRGFGVGRVGHNPYFFAEKRDEFNQHWYIQLISTLWKLLRSLPLLIAMQFRLFEGNDNVLRLEHKLGQIDLLLHKRGQFDSYTKELRTAFPRR